MSLQEREEEARRLELSRHFKPGDPRREPGYWREKVEQASAMVFSGQPRRYRAPRPGDALTAHEERVLGFVKAGRSVDAIARVMDLPPRSITTTIQRLRQKGRLT